MKRFFHIDLEANAGKILKVSDDGKSVETIILPEGAIEDVLVQGVSVVTEGIAEIDLIAENVFYDNETSGLNSTNVQGAVDQVNAEMNYNAIFTFDATGQSAPHNLPRGYNWHIDILEPLTGSYQYSRYFYTSFEDSELDTTGNPNLAAAVAHWVIDGKHIYFEYLDNGNVNTVVDVTDVTGAVVNSPFRPIPMGDTWFFGEIQLDPFPETDSVRSIIDINVSGLYMMMGNTFNLDTENKQIVGAINEVNAKASVIPYYEASDVVTAQQYSQENPGVLVYVPK